MRYIKTLLKLFFATFHPLPAFAMLTCLRECNEQAGTQAAKPPYGFACLDNLCRRMVQDQPCIPSAWVPGTLSQDR